MGDEVQGVKIIECPRDAWQGLPRVIPTEEKVEYLRLLAQAGFRRIDAVSFVSPRHVPQMADSEQVMTRLAEDADFASSGAEIIGIVVNEKGLERAFATPGVSTIGYPYSISERFTRQNANMSQEQSRQLVENIQQRLASAGQASRGLVVYISMAFGNPYGEPWSADLVLEALEWLRGMGVRCVSLADTVGKASPSDVSDLLGKISRYAGLMEIGVHLHSRPETSEEKILAAYYAGCRRFDSALTGLGGCPFAGDELVGNVDTLFVISALSKRGVETGVQDSALGEVINVTTQIREHYGH